MRRILVRGCLAGAFAAAAIVIPPVGSAVAATAVEYSAPDLGSRVGGVANPDSLPGSDMKIPCTPSGLC